MHGRRTRTVRIVAAGLAATVVGLSVPAPRLAAQKADPSQSPSSPIEKKGDPTSPPPPEPEVNPLPPAFTPAPRAAKGTTVVATSPAYTPEGTLADPEGAAKAFVERSQKEAEEAVAALSKEAEALRARLQKVEAGLARWQAVKESLGATVAARPAWRGRVIEGAVVPGRAPAPGLRDDEPLILDPIPASPDEPNARPAAPGRETPSTGTVKPSEGSRTTEPSPGSSTPKGVVHAPSTTTRRFE